MFDNAPTLSVLSGAISKLHSVGRVNSRVKAKRAFSYLPLFKIPWEASASALTHKLLRNENTKFEWSGGPHPMGSLYNGSGWAASASR